MIIAVEPKIYSKPDHDIPLDRIDPHAITVVRRLREHGFEAFLVGGCVRDLLLGHKPKDFDISTSAQPEQIKRLFRNSFLVGRRFRLAHIRFGKKVFEVATFRAGSNEADELITHDNVWGNAEEDAMRRDFTINGLYFDPFEETVIDYVGGFEDAKKEKLVCIGQPYLRFKQDPVRMIRLLKFQARFGLQVDEELHTALLDCRAEILKSSQARLLEELFRMLESGAAKRFFHLLADHGMLELLLPRLSGFLEDDEEGQIYDFLDEIDRMFLEYPDLTIDRAVLVSALVFPILNERLHSLMKMHDKPPHLGIVQVETASATNSVFHPFFQIPRRMKADVVSILASQYRMVPLVPKKRRTARVPNIPSFVLALKFLNLRYRLDPALQTHWEEWSAAFKTHKPRKRHVPRRRSRSR
ncbi:MAG: polynucleotide adenylyltransferase PcnB [Simkaniaceae bacterium]|nr:polynucleotide adenylyltransferase PcnB [Simkaniaceae bacterium]